MNTDKESGKNMEGKELVAKAIEIAVRAHEGQLGKTGEPYILHPFRVMLNVGGDEAKAAAVLHDVLEDTEMAADDLRDEGIPEKVIHLVKLLTKEEGKPYSDQIFKACKNPTAKEIKRADIMDNSRKERMDGLDRKTRKRLKKKYAEGLKLLESIK